MSSIRSYSSCLAIRAMVNISRVRRLPKTSSDQSATKPTTQGNSSMLNMGSGRISSKKSLKRVLIHLSLPKSKLCFRANAFLIVCCQSQIMLQTTSFRETTSVIIASSFFLSIIWLFSGKPLSKTIQPFCKRMNKRTGISSFVYAGLHISKLLSSIAVLKLATSVFLPCVSLSSENSPFLLMKSLIRSEVLLIVLA